VPDAPVGAQRSRRGRGDVEGSSLARGHSRRARRAARTRRVDPGSPAPMRSSSAGSPMRSQRTRTSSASR
jgi:hypothetical protein